VEGHLGDPAVGRAGAKGQDRALADGLKGRGQITPFEHDDAIVERLQAQAAKLDRVHETQPSG